MLHSPRRIFPECVCSTIVLLCLALTEHDALVAQDAAETAADFPDELLNWSPHPANPIFAGTAGDTWDRKIRERGFILREGDRWHLWYTGYGQEEPGHHLLGYATSDDGIRWKRHPGNPVYDASWVEDMCVVKRGDTYWMFAEGLHDVAHMLTSKDGLQWKEQGPLDIRQTDGSPLTPGPYGTPTVWIEDDTWYLFYERADRGIWLANSSDGRRWTNVQDQPVIAMGPEPYDRHAVALNQVIRYQGRYYGVYHANGDPQWKGPWTTCLAVSDDLVHWTKYAGNPVIRSNDSSGIFVDDGRQLRLYTMHPAVKLWLPRR
jgi:hypothetical protein